MNGKLHNTQRQSLTEPVASRICNSSFFFFSNCRGDPHTTTRGRQQVPLLLPHSAHSTQGRGIPGAVPRPNHSSRQTDSQHGHHDVHIWGGGLSTWLLAYRECLCSVSTWRPLSDWERWPFAGNSGYETSKWRLKETRRHNSKFMQCSVDLTERI